jgi:hypothetical protein
MSNNYRPHIHVLVEDDHNRQIANGFLLELNDNRAVKVLPLADGWKKAVEKFTKDYASDMKQLPERMMVFLIDFDNNFEKRLSYVENRIPEELKARVFVLGVLSEPRNLKTALNQKSYEEIGKALAKDCSDHTHELWGHDLLKHNKAELDRMPLSVKQLLFK